MTEPSASPFEINQLALNQYSFFKACSRREIAEV
jgi:hypothetical protein